MPCRQGGQSIGVGVEKGIGGDINRVHINGLGPGESRIEIGLRVGVELELKPQRSRETSELLSQRYRRRILNVGGSEHPYATNAGDSFTGDLNSLADTFDQWHSEPSHVASWSSEARHETEPNQIRSPHYNRDRGGCGLGC